MPSNFDVQSARMVLESLRNDIRGRYLGQFEDEGDDGYRTEFYEESARAEQLRNSAVLSERDYQRLVAIEAALQRLAEGRYGVCLGCDGAIDARRLTILPETTLCVACAEEFRGDAMSSAHQ